MGYEIQLAAVVDEKIGYERHPIGDASCTGDGGNTGVEFPTPEQIFYLWETYFEPCLLSSDNHNPILLQEFLDDTLAYVKAKTAIV